MKNNILRRWNIDIIGAGFAFSIGQILVKNRPTQIFSGRGVDVADCALYTTSVMKQYSRTPLKQPNLD
jgi:ribosomal protein L27